MARNIRIARTGQPHWNAIHAAKTAAEQRPRRVRETVAEEVEKPVSGLLGGGGAGGGLFCFVDLLPEPEDFEMSRSQKLRRAALREIDAMIDDAKREARKSR